jgi:hypothetical protein
MGGGVLLVVDAVLRITLARVWRYRTNPWRREPLPPPPVVRPTDVPNVKGARWGPWEEANWRQQQAVARYKAQAAQEAQARAEWDAGTTDPWFLSRAGDGLVAVFDGIACLRHPDRLHRGTPVVAHALSTSELGERAILTTVAWSSLDGREITVRVPAWIRATYGGTDDAMKLNALDCHPYGREFLPWTL